MISTNPASTEAGELYLSRGACFAPSCLELTARLAILSYDGGLAAECVLDAAGFRLFPRIMRRTHKACCKYEAALLYLLTTSYQ